MSRRRGFTLIELMAVLLILGLLTTIALPNFGLRSARALDGESRKLAADLEFVRSRAVMTGLPHRVTFDLETMAYWIESYRSEDVEEAPIVDEAVETGREKPVAMSPPRTEEPAWRRVQGTHGNVRRIHELVFIDGIETDQGYVDRGEFQLHFERDGTTDAAWIVFAEDGGSVITLAVAPLADGVRFEYGRL